MKNVYMGTLIKGWMNSLSIKYVTFAVTDDCNLACKYCYFTHKSSCNKMTFETAKKAIDYILSEERFAIYDGIVWDFIGGEPTLELDLIDQICDYILESMYKLNHKWLNCYKFMMCTNGLMYSSEKMQKLVKKHGINFQVSMTIDGNKEKHDLSRIKKDGSGSFDDVIKNVPLWLDQQGLVSTKSTFAHQDLPYLSDSIIALWNLGIVNVMANVVFEDVWEEGDAEIYETQLKKLADFVIENKLWDKYSVRFFDPKIGMPHSDSAYEQNFCGAGKMMAIGTDGKYYPCMRFMPSSLNNHEALVIGDVDHGVDFDKIRPFYALNVPSQSDPQCMDCEISAGCAWCTGFNYDCSDNKSIFQRKTYLCEMQKAQVRAMKYFWSRYETVTGDISPHRVNRLENVSSKNKYMYIIVGNEHLSNCQYTIKSENQLLMTDEVLKKSIEYCEKNDYIPVFLGAVKEEYRKYGYMISEDNEEITSSFCIPIITHENFLKSNNFDQNVSLIYKTNLNDLCFLYDDIEKLVGMISQTININIYIEDLNMWKYQDLEKYEQQLKCVSSLVYDSWENNHIVNINVMTHIFFLEKFKNCGVGHKNLTVAPDGDFYICPAFYYDEMVKDKYKIGSLENGLDNRYAGDCTKVNVKPCNQCDNFHCNRCVYMALKGTGELCVPTEIQCIKSNLERNISIDLLHRFQKSDIDLTNVRQNLHKNAYLDMLINVDKHNRTVTRYNKILKSRE